MTEEKGKKQDKEVTEEEKKQKQQEAFREQMLGAFGNTQNIFLEVCEMLINGYMLRVVGFAKTLGMHPLDLMKASKERILNAIVNFEKQFEKKEKPEEKKDA